MKFDEIMSKNWVVSDNLKVWHVREKCMCVEEQECHFNVSKVDDCIFVDCSYQSWITKLCKSKLFTLEKVVISISDSSSKNVVLSIQGFLDIKALSIGRKKRVLSDESKKRMSDQMRLMRRRNVN